jgi:6-phosphogluconolactonase
MPLLESTFDTADALNQAFSAKIAELLAADIQTQGNASLVVSGGRTPIGLFAALSNTDIDWSNVVITLADERWVNEDDDASNAKLVRTHLLVNNAAAATFVSMKTDHADAYEAQEAVAQRLESVPSPFTVTILGMGEDGHTASLFPCSKELQDGIREDNHNVCLAATPTTAPHQRMSLTLNAIVQSKNCFLHLTGDKKKVVLQDALADTSDIKPIVSVIQRADVTLYWAP